MTAQHAALIALAALLLLPMLACSRGSAAAAPAEARAATDPPRVQVRRLPGGGYTLLRGGRPYVIRGVGGTRDLELLKRIGGNSVRTWGHEQLDHTVTLRDGSTHTLPDALHRMGLTVAAGFWLQHPRHGFDYADADAVRRQLETLRAWVARHKHHPAVLCWVVGNEVEIGADPRDVFPHIEDAARAVKEIDPDRPVMTVIAEIGGDKARLVQDLCPSVDIIGINSYAGVRTLRERLAAQGVTKPYAVMEWGAVGHWEVGNTAWGQPIEPTTTQRAEFIADAGATNVYGQPNSLGGYAFLWGHKQETTATWYGLFLPTGERTQGIEALARLWDGEPLDNNAPRLEPLALPDHDPGSLTAGQPFTVRTSTTDPDGDALEYRWLMKRETTERRQGGDSEPPADILPEQLEEAAGPTARFIAPNEPGEYRVFLYLTDAAGGGASANIPVRVRPR